MLCSCVVCDTRFRDLLRDDGILSGLANSFQLDWLSQVFQSVAIVASLRRGVSLVEAAELGTVRTIDLYRRRSSDNDNADQLDRGGRRVAGRVR